ncbi:hypothetical protein P2G88_17480 [Aliiglaciecola sp. CAU 1673]|uniref:hypothetical protein n=1 Tax=Aliiglaciecola sp. CAU 1673 TaxID=3032595 RepID=UPI0023DB6F15|nr:hypothetical protein [Aliiglaciecola sp. CAU 1673]MDF2180050.1 hypothetical protein [Aliiglaciecola sp. CAU 1673]
MPDKSKKDKKSKKDSQLLIRIDKDMRDQFIELCEARDTKAAKEIRKFIASYINEHQ